jgi:hypothetical protein
VIDSEALRDSAHDAGSTKSGMMRALKRTLQDVAVRMRCMRWCGGAGGLLGPNRSNQGDDEYQCANGASK